ncbi:ABC transporter ATP-binding protein [Fulvitalea axinellae]|uniref:ABC transporter ATP-binding protein n=1 Tax=Fulvitalea axinellae TaxID=1182444 RepID=A0AAU9CUQ0_9BACT|nr:ABC transporter ATP-binding protein [Fulvitalea axinellae]
MISINNLSYYIGGRAIYDAASLHIKPKDRIGLVGKNGAGKSTLLRIIEGEYSPDGGSVSRGKDCTIGFLNQDLLSYQSDESILVVAMQAFEEANKIQKEIETTLAEMELGYDEKKLNRLTLLQERYEALGGYSLQSKAEEVLEGIGFSTEALQRPLKTFSGGWRMRVMLAKLLLSEPSLLMLDEPTNHLDLPSIQWVENYIKSYNGAVIVVSHDQEFLNNTTTSIVEVDGGKLVQYSGNYSFYLKEKAERLEIQQNAFENQQAKLKQTERFIERFRSKATKAKQVQSRVKSLEKMDMIEEAYEEKTSVNFSFGFSTESGRFVSTIKDVSKSFGPIKVLKNASAQIEKGDKIALIGANGKGKSTLLRIIDGSEPLDAGESSLGHNVIPGFYAQHQLEALHTENEIIDELKTAGSGKTEQELRDILGGFLFRGDDIYKKIKVLSGGEKSRVALAKTLLTESNFLLLDEPTNHLDIRSVDILINALNQYQGSFITVSHDRRFIGAVANKIWYIEDHQIKEYPGTYAEYVDWKRRRELEEAGEEKSEKKEKAVSVDKEERLKLRQERDKINKELRRKRKSLEKTEEQIEKLETLKGDIENLLALPEVFANLERLAEENGKLQQTEKELEELNEEWENLALEIEELEEKMSD